MIHRLVARQPKGSPWSHHDWVSRDHADIDCRAVSCRYNLAEKCMVPSRCEIDERGSCKGYEVKPTPKVEGD